MEKIKGKNFIYLHTCILNNWEEVTINILNKINESGLINEIDTLYLFVLGDITLENLDKVNKIIKLNPKYKLRKIKNTLNIYERLTLNQILDDCQNKYENCKILYLHSKGITRCNDWFYSNVTEWVDLLIYFNITKYKDCLKELDNFDTCGINLRTDDRYSDKNNHNYHYSGNFWWANSDYIKILPKLETKDVFNDRDDYIKYYLKPEMWICSKAKKCISLHDSNIDHYMVSYKLDKYKDKINKKIVEL